VIVDEDAAGPAGTDLQATAWLDPSIITGEKTLYLDPDIGHGATYGNTLSWIPQNQPQMICGQSTSSFA
jgi:hypothetical protein